MNDKLKNLWRYIFPAIGGLFVTYLYNVIDGIFVGQGVGSAALGAVNIGVPFTPVLLLPRRCFLWAEQQWQPSEWAVETGKERIMPL